MKSAKELIEIYNTAYKVIDTKCWRIGNGRDGNEQKIQIGTGYSLGKYLFITLYPTYIIPYMANWDHELLNRTLIQVFGDNAKKIYKSGERTNLELFLDKTEILEYTMEYFS